MLDWASSLLSKTRLKLSKSTSSNITFLVLVPTPPSERAVSYSKCWCTQNLGGYPKFLQKSYNRFRLLWCESPHDSASAPVLTFLFHIRRQVLQFVQFYTAKASWERYGTMLDADTDLLNMLPVYRSQWHSSRNALQVASALRKFGGSMQAYNLRWKIEHKLSF